MNPLLLLGMLGSIGNLIGNKSTPSPIPNRTPDFVPAGGEQSALPHFFPKYTPNPNQDTSANPYKDIMQSLLKRESGGNYNAQNPWGYIGGFQFGPSALETVNFLKPGASKGGKSALENPENWAIPGGKEAFLKNPELQELAMQRFLAHNKKRLTAMGYINQNTPQNIINALLSVAHLGGIGGVQKLMWGQNPRDQLGTGVREYYNLGLRS